jgi:hypothetical protein
VIGFKRYEGLIARAIKLLKEDKALPVDLQTKLLAIGVDVGALENTHG